MDAKRKVEIECLLKRLDVIKIDLQTMKDAEQDNLDCLADSDPRLDEVQSQEDLVDLLEGAIGHFDKTLEYLVEASFC